MKPYLRLLTEEDLESIHNASLRILEQTGMLIDHDKAREILQKEGAEVDHDRKIVKFPPQLVEEKLKFVPKSITYHGRTPEYDITLSPDGDIYARVAGGAIKYVDLKTGENRRARIDDWKEFAILFDAMPNVQMIATLHCSDVPAQTSDIHSIQVLLENQRKAIIHNAFSLENHRHIIEMLLAVRGSKEELSHRPLMHHMLSPISPLFLDENNTAQLLLACEYGIPTDIPIMPSAAATAPITLAGTLALANAEFLGTMTLAQSARRGHSMPYFMDPVVADLRTGEALFGAPEIGILNAAVSQLGVEFYGFPPQGIGLASDGFSAEQTLFQRCQNTLMQCLAGGKLIIGAGTVESVMALSPVQLVIDNEIMSIARRWLRGIEVNEDTLAVEVIHRVGQRGHFLGDKHTLKYARSGELIGADILERGRRSAWLSQGGKNMEQKARERALVILAKHQVDPLPRGVVEELRKIVNRADKEIMK